MTPREMANTAKKYGIYIGFFLLCIVLAILSPTFLNPRNIVNILRQTSINGVLAIGMTFVIITGGIDLSVGSVVALSAVISATFAQEANGLPLVVPVFMALLVGSTCGLTNGLLIAKTRIAPFVATLGMMTIARGLALVTSAGRPVISLSESYRILGRGTFLGMPVPVLLFLLALGTGYFVLTQTRFGRHVYALGGNELSAKYSGVRITRVQILVYVISGFTAAISGLILSSRVMSGSPVAGVAYELDAIAAVVIGGTSLSGGVGSLIGSFVGALMIGVINNGLDLLNVSSYFQQIVKGVIIILAVVLDQRSHQKQ